MPDPIDTLEIEVDAGTPAPGAPPAATPPASEQQPSADELAALRARIAEQDAATRQRDDEIAKMRESAAKAEAERTALINQQFAAYESAGANHVVAAQGDYQTAKAEYARALEAGEYAEVAEAQARMNEAQIKLREGEQYLKNLESHKAAYAAKIEREQAERAAADKAAAEQPADPLAHLHPKAREWIDAHPAFRTDSAYRAHAVAAAEYAKSRLGLAENSPEYFAHVDEAMRAFEEAGDTPPAPATTTRKPAARTPAAAPPSRSTGATSQHATRPRTYQLTAQEREIADATMSRLYPDPVKRYQRYAENRERMNAEKPMNLNGAF